MRWFKALLGVLLLGSAGVTGYDLVLGNGALLASAGMILATIVGGIFLFLYACKDPKKTSMTVVKGLLAMLLIVGSGILGIGIVMPNGMLMFNVMIVLVLGFGGLFLLVYAVKDRKPPKKA